MARCQAHRAGLWHNGSHPVRKYAHTGPVRATELVQWPRWPNGKFQRIHFQPHGRQAGRQVMAVGWAEDNASSLKEEHVGLEWHGERGCKDTKKMPQAKLNAGVLYKGATN